MIQWLQIIVLSLVQGLTEFLPVSSSAHLILVPELLGWPDQGMAFDIAVHIGTLIAVLSYFKQDLCRMVIDGVQVLRTRQKTPYSSLFWAVAWGTVPVGIIGFVFKSGIAQYLRSPLIIALSTIAFGIFLGVADRTSKKLKTLQQLNKKDIAVIGFAQALSLIPGTSRSGITLTAGLLRGFTFDAAARYSFLLSMPVIVLAGGLELITLMHSNLIVQWPLLAGACLLAALSGYVCINFCMRLLPKIGLMPFVMYRIILGVYLIIRFYA